jgi:CDP-4-dehydro-6-deoxyglucose reductase
MRCLQQKLTGFNFLPTLSREEWDGRKGYVHSIYEQLCKTDPPENNNAYEPLPAYFYLCGWKAMIDEARQRIVQLGYDRKAIHLELYG